MSKFPLREDKLELIPHDYPGYPVYVGTELLSENPNSEVFPHWHNEFEILLPLKGRMVYGISGEELVLTPEQGIFISSGYIHGGHYYYRGEDCEFIYVLFHPILLCSSVDLERDYVRPVLENAGLKYLALNNTEEWKQEIRRTVFEIYESSKADAAPLLLQSLFFRLWYLIYENSNNSAGNEPHDQQMTTLKAMLTFIHENYSNNIYLNDIAASGNVGKTKCNLIFNKYLNISPVKYLLNYRLLLSMKLLEEGDRSVTEIALDVGFSNLSYYIQAFREKYGYTPSQHVKRKGGGTTKLITGKCKTQNNMYGIEFPPASRSDK